MRDRHRACCSACACGGGCVTNVDTGLAGRGIWNVAGLAVVVLLNHAAGRGIADRCPGVVLQLIQLAILAMAHVQWLCKHELLRAGARTATAGECALTVLCALPALLVLPKSLFHVLAALTALECLAIGHAEDPAFAGYAPWVIPKQVTRHDLRCSRRS